MKLKQIIQKEKPRENSGSRSANRFDYQKDWAILKLIELHKSKKEYLLVMDYYDDIVVFDSDTEPTNVSFYQVKTKGSNWTVNSLLNRKKGENGPLLSIIGKMYECKMKFPKHTLSLNFISNSKFKVKLKGEKTNVEKELVCLNDLNDIELTTIIKQIREEHLLEDEPDFVKITFLKKENLNIDEREAFVTGKLSTFLEEINPQGKFKMSLVYKSLFNEVKRKNNYEGEIYDYQSLAKNKGISKSEFSTMISHFTNDNKVEKVWQMVENRMTLENIDMLEIMEISNEWETYHIEKLDLTNLKLQELNDKINVIVESHSKTIENFHADFVEIVYSDFRSKHKENLYSEHYIKAIIISRYFKL